MNDFLELWLIRHGETDYNRDHRIQGQSNNPLSTLGTKQAECLAPRLADESFDLIYCSDLKRARTTAELACPGRKLIFDQRLREISSGVFEGKLKSELRPDELEMFETGERTFELKRAPEGESYQDLSERVVDWLDELPREGKIASFSHGGVIRSVLYYLAGQPEAYTEKRWRFSVHNASISIVHLTKDFGKFVHLNDTGHLGGLEPPDPEAYE